MPDKVRRGEDSIRSTIVGMKDRRMVRPHLFEFLDLPWYPAALRNLQTDALQRMTGPAFAAVVPLIQRTLRQAGTSRVIDLCSGAGGPWPQLRLLVGEPDAVSEITLTDRFPNLPRFERLREESDGQIGFVAQPVDAQAVPAELVGMRTIFSAFHHLRPDEAAGLLRNASETGAALGVFDVGSARTDVPSVLRTLAFLALAPVVFLFTYFIMTPRLGPLTWPRVLFTYFIPIVPLVTWWDFLVTAFRAYTRQEMEKMVEMVAMVATLGGDSYVWEVGEVRTKQFPINYILGYPQAHRHNRGPP